jgi:hypothetical protein
MSSSKRTTALRKRKRETSQTRTTTKRPRSGDKTSTSTPPDPPTTPEEVDPTYSQEAGPLCPAREILKEKGKKYLIAWEDHPETGEKFEPTWEPKKYANAELVEEWKAIKAAKRASGKPVAKTKSKGNTRDRRIIESSPIAEPTPFEPAQNTQDTAQGNQSAEGTSGNTVTKELAESPAEHQAEARAAPAIEISRPAGFDPAEYERTLTQQTALNSSSQAATSPTASGSSGAGSVGEPATPQSVAPSTPDKSGEERVVPDSQGPSDSYIVSTQTGSEQLNPSQPLQIDEADGQVAAASESAKKAVNSHEENGIASQDFAGISKAETIDSAEKLAKHSACSTDSASQESVQVPEDSFQPAQIIPASSYPSSPHNESEAASSPTSILPTTEVVKNTPPKSLQPANCSSSISPEEPSIRSQSLPSVPKQPLNVLNTRASPKPRPKPQPQPSWVRQRRSSIEEGLAAKVAKRRMDREAVRRRAQLEKDATDRATASPSLSGVPGTRSPSTIPARAPAQAAETPLITTALANSSAMEMSPPARPVPASSAAPDHQISARSLITPQLDKDEFIVPLSFNSDDKDVSQKNTYRGYVQDFIEASSGADSPKAESINDFINDLQNAELHLELCIPKHETLTPVTQAYKSACYSRDTSVKFGFLHHLLHLLKHKDLHIIIVACDRLLNNTTELFLKGKKIHYEYPSELRRSSQEEVEGKLSVTMISSEKDNSPVVRFADLIVCLDHTYDLERVKKLRGNHLTNPNHASPIIHPVIAYSSEHVKYCIRSSVPGPENLKIIANCVTQLQDKIGKVEDASRLSKDKEWNKVAAGVVANYVDKIARGAFTDWTLSPIGSVKSHITLEPSSVPSQHSSASTPRSPKEATGSLKRPFEAVTTSETSKKMRMTPQPHSPNAGDVTRISDSIGGVTQPQVSTMALELAQVKAELKTTQDRLKAETKHKNEICTTLDDRIIQWEKGLDQITSLNEEIKKANAAVETLTATNDRLNQRLDKKDSDIADIKEKLEAERNASLTSKDTIITENASLRAEIVEANAAKDKAQKSLENVTKDYEYVRNMYQAGSTTVMDQTNTIEQLTTDNAKLKRESSDTRTKMQEKAHSSREASQKQQIESLQRQLANAKSQYDMLSKKYARDTTRAGMGTRQTSVPRSPRVGGNGGSRAASPLPGSRLKALKNG